MLLDCDLLVILSTFLTKKKFNLWFKSYHHKSRGKSVKISVNMLNGYRLRQHLLLPGPENSPWDKNRLNCTERWEKYSLKVFFESENEMAVDWIMLKIISKISGIMKINWKGARNLEGRHFVVKAGSQLFTLVNNESCTPLELF